MTKSINEEVEVVAYIDNSGSLYTAKLLEIMNVESDGCEQLMTVTQHQRIVGGLQEYLDCSQNDYLSLHTMYTDLLCANAQLKAERDQLKAEIEVRSRHHETLLADNNTLKAEVERLRLEVFQLDNSVTCHHRENEALRTKLAQQQNPWVGRDTKRCLACGGDHGNTSLPCPNMTPMSNGAKP